jgi:hypothetical protein
MRDHAPMTNGAPARSIEVLVAAGGLALFTAVGVSAAFSGCGGRASSPSAEADAGTGASPPGPADGGKVPAATQEDDAEAPSFGELPDAMFPPTRFDAGPAPLPGPQPVVACGGDAGDAGDGGAECPLPESRCLDDYWLLSYTKGTCTGATCAYQEVLFDCSQGQRWWVHCGGAACVVTNPE